MSLGFRHAFRAGISFGKDDMIIPGDKEKLVDETRDQVKEYEQQYQDGLITQQEKYNKVIDAWSRCGDHFFFQAEDGIRDLTVTGVQTCALPICYINWRCCCPTNSLYIGLMQFASVPVMVPKQFRCLFKTLAPYKRSHDNITDDT